MTDQQAYSSNDKRVLPDSSSSVVVSDCAVALPQFSNNSRLDSGFQSGGSLASCNHLSSYGQQQHSAEDKQQQQQQLAAHHREFNRLDSGLCEQIHDSLNISDVGDFGAGKSLSPLSSFTALSTQQQQQQLVSPHSPVATTVAAPTLTPTSKAVEDFFSVDADGDCQLHLAIADGATEIVFALIRMAPHPSFLDIQNNEMYAPLHIAVLVNQPAMVRRLVVAGAATGAFIFFILAWVISNIFTFVSLFQLSITRL